MAGSPGEYKISRAAPVSRFYPPGHPINGNVTVNEMGGLCTGTLGAHHVPDTVGELLDFC